MILDSTFTIPAGGANMQVTAGKYLSVKSCTLPIKASFNGGPLEPTQAGQVTDKSAQPFSYVNFVNPNAMAVTLTCFIGDQPVTYQPSDNSAANAQTYCLGNLGIASGAAANGGLPACDATGLLQITDGMALVIPSTNNGHRRQSITFSMSPTTPKPLNVLDANGNNYMTIYASQQIEIVSDSVFQLSGALGIASVTVGQIFLSSN